MKLQLPIQTVSFYISLGLLALVLSSITYARKTPGGMTPLGVSRATTRFKSTHFSLSGPPPTTQVSDTDKRAQLMEKVRRNMIRKEQNKELARIKKRRRKELKLKQHLADTSRIESDNLEMEFASESTSVPVEENENDKLSQVSLQNPDSTNSYGSSNQPRPRLIDIMKKKKGE
mmetsp:Transcript_24524/g.40886  ORF Transcript_24524/g.40886 Transcript_24524/m.40886 type:complete len:174 (+) Transcript_24524:119-640(+)